MEKDKLLHYINRWKEVEKIETRELQQMDMETRFNITAALFAPKNHFPQDKLFAQKDAAEVKKVRERWLLLKQRIIKGGKKSR